MSNKLLFTPAVRRNVPLLIGLAGSSGSGKTFSAMCLAEGLSGGSPFAVIDTESGRALHYADRFKFDHADVAAPFRPDAYLDAILAADAAKYPVILVDSMSHVWAGEGGVVDWQEEELTRMAGDDYRKREACKMAAWIKPKTAHKKMVQRLLQLRAYVILCFRAEKKVEMAKNEQGRTVITEKTGPTVRDGWVSICEKNLPYELTASFLLTAEKPGVLLPIKLQDQHRSAFDLARPVTPESGRKLAEWAAGGPAKVAANAVQKQATAPDASLDDAIWAAEAIGEEKAREGIDALKAWWAQLPAGVKTALKPKLDTEWKPAAEAVKGAA